MLHTLTFVALVAVLFFGAAGIGHLGVTVLRRAGFGDHASLSFPLELLFGVALFIALGGFLVALGIATPFVLLTCNLIGAGVFFAGRVRNWSGFRTGIRWRPRYIANCAIGATFALMSIGGAIGIAFYNPPDDDPAYVYLAQRLASTGGLIDPFNLRRFASYGASTLYQSLFLRFTGNASLRGFEFTFAVLLVLVVVIRSTRRRWLPLFFAVVGLGVLVGQGVGPIINLSPAYSIAAFTLGGYQVLGRAWAPGREEQRPFLYLVLGSFLAAILAFRWSFLVSVSFAVVAVTLALGGRRSTRPFVVVGLSGLVCSAGWLIAQLRSAGTFLPVGGNLDPSYPGGNTPSIALSELANKATGVFNEDGAGQIALLGIVVALVFLLGSSRASKRMLVLLAAGLGTLIQLAFFTYVFSGSVTNDITRFVSPSSLACGLFALDTLWPVAQQHHSSNGRLSVAQRDRGRPRSRRSGRRLTIPLAIQAIATLAVVCLTFGDLPVEVVVPIHNSMLTASGMQRVRLGALVAAGSEGFQDRYALVRAEFARVNQLIPRGSKVLASVEEPALLDFGKFRFATLDIAGAASPPPHMPYFAGAAAKVAYLRHLGYDYILYQLPQLGDLYGDWRDFVVSSSYYRRAYASYFADWQSTVQTLEADTDYRSLYVGTLALIKI